MIQISAKLIAMLNTVPKREDGYVFNPNRSTAESVFQSQRNRLTKKLGNPRLKQLHFHTFRHYYATMLYAKSLNILKVQQNLGHRDLKNTQIYTHLVNFPSEEYDCQIGETREEAKRLIQAGYEYVCEVDGGKFFRKRK